MTTYRSCLDDVAGSSGTTCSHNSVVDTPQSSSVGDVTVGCSSANYCMGPPNDYYTPPAPSWYGYNSYPHHLYSRGQQGYPSLGYTFQSPGWMPSSQPNEAGKAPFLVKIV